jgi:hypothetical protein
MSAADATVTLAASNPAAMIKPLDISKPRNMPTPQRLNVALQITSDTFPEDLRTFKGITVSLAERVDL